MSERNEKICRSLLALFYLTHADDELKISYNVYEIFEKCEVTSRRTNPHSPLNSN